jgi:hypothetical protein
MTYLDLRELCDLYGLQVDFNITGQWTVGDPEAGLGYRVYVWEIASAWPMRVLARVGFEELKAMNRDQLERIIVECGIMAMAPAE